MSAIQVTPVQSVTFEVNGKVFKTEAEAEAYLATLKNLEEGLAYAKAQFPEQSERGLQTKANTIEAYLNWVEAGRPVKELETTEAE